MNFNIDPQNISVATYAIVFFGGVLISFSPCVYPLIPVTAAYIGASSSGKRLRGFLLSVFYILGIASVYSCLGLFAALSGKIFGEISTSPWTYLVVGIIFFILGLSMFDIFILPMMNFLKPNVPYSSHGVLKAFLVGASSGLVVSPCTAPALGAVLTYVASRQNLFLGATLLFTFALGMGCLLLAVGTFAGIAVSLPKAGTWLNNIKKIFGAILIICAIYFIFLAIRRFS